MSCVPCFASSCLVCAANAQVCIVCNNPYGVFNNTCIPCNDINCINCRTNYTSCGQCANPYGVNITSRRCVLCADTNCTNCQQNHMVCVQCASGYGLTASATCVLCNSSASYCFNCSVYNILQCTSCPITRFLNGTVCSSCIANCNNCTNNATCTICQDGYYR